MNIETSGRPCAIVISEGMNGLGMLRSLGQEGVPCYLITTSESRYLARCRYATAVAITETQSDTELLGLIKGFGQRGSVIIVGTDQYMDFLVRQRDRLSADYSFFLPDPGVFNTLVDKKLEIERMREIDVPLPESHIDLNSIVDDELDFPQILKPRTFEYLEELGAKNLIIGSERDFVEFRERFSGRLDHYVMQKVIGGSDDRLWVCNCTFNENCELVSVFVFQRFRTTPPHFGVTSVAVSRYNDTIVQHVTAIGHNLGYTGPAMFEFKLDPADQLFKYIEINPRIGMCNYFDTRCGVNNVFNTYCLAAGLPLPPQSRQIESTIFINLLPDVKARLQDGESSWAIAASYLKFLFCRRVGAFWALSDPLPAVFWFWSRLIRQAA